jgi:hypothetical protein
MYDWHQQMERARAAKAARGTLGKGRGVRVLSKTELKNMKHDPIMAIVRECEAALVAGADSFRLEAMMICEGVDTDDGWIPF